MQGNTCRCGCRCPRQYARTKTAKKCGVLGFSFCSEDCIRYMLVAQFYSLCTAFRTSCKLDGGAVTAVTVSFQQFFFCWEISSRGQAIMNNHLSRAKSWLERVDRPIHKQPRLMAARALVKAPPGGKGLFERFTPGS